MKIRLRPTDKLWTKYLRRKQDFTCQKCGKRYVYTGQVIANLRNLGVSHFFSRRKESTRFDIRNTDLLCNLPCHEYWGGEGRREYEEFMIKKLGQDGLDLLYLESETYKKRDDFTDELVIKHLIKELE